VIALLWPVLCAVFIYISNNADLLKGMGKQFQSFIEVDGGFFMVFMNVQAVFARFSCRPRRPRIDCARPGKQRAALYFSRPCAAQNTLAPGSSPSWECFPRHLDPGADSVLECRSMADEVVSSQLENWIRNCHRLSVWILLVSLVALASSALRG